MDDSGSLSFSSLVRRRIDLAQEMSPQNQFASRGIKLVTSEFLANGDGLNGIFDHSLPTHEGRHGAHDDVADFFAVDNHFDVIGEQLLEFFEKPTSPFVDFLVIFVVVRAMLVIDIQLVVVMQVVWGRDDADEATEMVFSDPDDLFLAANSAMVIAIASGAFTYG